MKIFLCRATKFLGPFTPYQGIVVEADEQKAIEAFITPSSPFDEGFVPMTRFWFEGRMPKVSDFQAKVIGLADDRYPDNFSEKLRSPETNIGPVLSKEEIACRDFMRDRVILRVFRSGGSISRWLFNLKLSFVAKLRQLANGIEAAIEREDFSDIEEPTEQEA